MCLKLVFPENRMYTWQMSSGSTRSTWFKCKTGFNTGRSHFHFWPRKFKNTTFWEKGRIALYTWVHSPLIERTLLSVLPKFSLLFLKKAEIQYKQLERYYDVYFHVCWVTGILGHWITNFLSKYFVFMKINDNVRIACILWKYTVCIHV